MVTSNSAVAQLNPEDYLQVKYPIGVAKAVGVVNSPYCVFGDAMKATCYLSYRYLEGKFDDLAKIPRIIPNAIKMAEHETETSPSSSEPYRWKCSLNIVAAYIQILKPFDESYNAFPYDNLEACLDFEISDRHPSQCVNIMRSAALIYHKKLKTDIQYARQMPKKMKKYHEDMLKLNEKIAELPENEHIIKDHFNKAYEFIFDPFNLENLGRELAKENNPDKFFYMCMENIITDQDSYIP